MKIKNLFILLHILTFNCFFAQIPTNGLLAFYPFDGNTNDEIGNHNGVAYNLQSSADRNGNENGAYFFNGSNSYIDLKNNFIGNNDFTISMWFKTNYSGHINTLLSTRHSDNTFSNTLVIENNNAELSLDGPGYFKLFKANNSVNDNLWHFFLVCKNGSNYNVYLDGKLANNGIGNISVDNSSIHIGHHGAWNNYFYGSIDNLRIYNRILSGSEIQQLYSNDNAKPIKSSLASKGKSTTKNTIAKNSNTLKAKGKTKTTISKTKAEQQKVEKTNRENELEARIKELENDKRSFTNTFKIGDKVCTDGHWITYISGEGYCTVVGKITSVSSDQYTIEILYLTNGCNNEYFAGIYENGNVMKVETGKYFTFFYKDTWRFKCVDFN